jgi:hypothetical protein
VLLTNKGGDPKIKLFAEAGTTEEEKDAYFLQQYQKFEQYVYWFLGKMVFNPKTTATAWTITRTTC